MGREEEPVETEGNSEPYFVMRHFVKNPAEIEETSIHAINKVLKDKKKTEEVKADEEEYVEEEELDSEDEEQRARSQTFPARVARISEADLKQKDVHEIMDLLVEEV